MELGEGQLLRTSYGIKAKTRSWVGRSVVWWSSLSDSTAPAWLLTLTTSKRLTGCLAFLSSLPLLTHNPRLSLAAMLLENVGQKVDRPR